MTRAHIVLATVVACAFGALVGLYAARHDDTPAKTGFDGALRPPGIPPARFSLTDQEGRRVSARSLRALGPFPSVSQPRAATSFASSK